jgi:hypothetical protein
MHIDFHEAKVAVARHAPDNGNAITLRVEHLYGCSEVTLYGLPAAQTAALVECFGMSGTGDGWLVRDFRARRALENSERQGATAVSG